MPKNRTFSFERQKWALYLLEWSVGFRPAGSVWVLLLALRGFSMLDIGLAEGVFHIVSLCGELPSGLLADILGRKRTLAASQAMFLVSALLMAVSNSLPGVYASLAVQALAYNLESGTREAMTYETMLQAGREAEYLHFSSLQNSIYRISSGAAMLLAGATVLLGWRMAYMLDAFVILTGLVSVCAMVEPVPPDRLAQTAPRTFSGALQDIVQGAYRLLRADKTAICIMLLNALVGAFATLTGFFLQQRVEAAIPLPVLLGPALFVLGLGGGLAGLLAKPLDRLPYIRAALLTGLGTVLCALLARGGCFPVLMLAGFFAGLLDDALQLVSDKRLNDRFPSSQRATLVSVSSMVFSLCMIPLSPVFGWYFS